MGGGARESGVQDHPRLDSEFKTSPGHIRLYLERKEGKNEEKDEERKERVNSTERQAEQWAPSCPTEQAEISR